jgi:hypothetical protein
MPPGEGQGTWRGPSVRVTSDRVGGARVILDCGRRPGGRVVVPKAGEPRACPADSASRARIPKRGEGSGYPGASNAPGVFARSDLGRGAPLWTPTCSRCWTPIGELAPVNLMQ